MIRNFVRDGRIGATANEISGWRWPRVTVVVAARRTLADRGQLLVVMGFLAVLVVALGALWRAAAGANDGVLAGYTAVALTWYIATSETAINAINIRLIEEISDDISSGAVASELLRPAPILGVRLATEFGRALPRLAACAGTAIVVSVIAVGAPPDPAALALAAPSLVLAVGCNLLAQHTFAAAAFWARDARATWFLYHKFVFITGGMLLPIQLLPDGLAAASWSMPFVAMAYAPARLAAGHFEPELLLLQVGWLVVLAGAAVAAFTAGQRRLQVVGG